MTKREMIMKAVESLGYKPQIDEDGDISIYYQMKSIYLITDQEDEPYVMVALPQFANVDEGDETMALAVCNKTTQTIKLAKVYIDQTFKSVSAHCDFFYTDEKSLKYNIEYALKILGIIRSTYIKAKAELIE